jgi:hypothetical protein
MALDVAPATAGTREWRAPSAGTAAFAATAVPGLDAESRQVLLSRLLAEGVLQPA